MRAGTLIEYGDFKSFYSSIYCMATRIKAIANTIDAQRLPVSASEAYVRTASYFHAADFFLHGNIYHPRLYSLWDSQTAAFNKAISLLPVPGKRINIQGNWFQILLISYSPPDSDNTHGQTSTSAAWASWACPSVPPSRPTPSLTATALPPSSP